MEGKVKRAVALLVWDKVLVICDVIAVEVHVRWKLVDEGRRKGCHKGPLPFIL
jgi:hypothetical protein